MSVSAWSCKIIIAESGSVHLIRLDEIRKRYRNEWMLVEFSKLDKDLRVKDGKVIALAPNKDDIYKALLDTRGKT